MQTWHTPADLRLLIYPKKKKKKKVTLFTQRKCAAGWHGVDSSLFVASTLYLRSYFPIFSFWNSPRKLPLKRFRQYWSHTPWVGKTSRRVRTQCACIFASYNERQGCVRVWTNEWLLQFWLHALSFPTHFRPHYLIYFVSAVRINWNIYLMELEYN